MSNKSDDRKSSGRYDFVKSEPVLSKFTNESQVAQVVWLVAVEMDGRRSIRSDFLDVSALGGGYHRPP